MNDIVAAHEAAKASELTGAASAVETAIVGVMAVLLEDEKLDAEVQELIEGLRIRAHRIRRIAAVLARGVR